MRTVRKLLAGVLVVSVGLPAVTFAQERHVVDAGALAAAVSEHVAGQDADRAAVHDVFSRPAVREAAAMTGVDLDRLVRGIDTLSGARLEQAANAAQTINRQLVGGQVDRTLGISAIVVAVMVVMIVWILKDFDDTCFKAECYPL